MSQGYCNIPGAAPQTPWCWGCGRLRSPHPTPGGGVAAAL